MMHNDAQSRDGERQCAPRLTNKRKYFSHLAGSKIASHPVATRLTARVRQHVRNSMRTTANGMCSGQATKKCRQETRADDSASKNTPSSVFIPPLPQRSAQPIIAS